MVILSKSSLYLLAGAQENCENGFCGTAEKPEEIPKGANAEGRPREAIVDCVDRHPKECADYASWGECEKNPGELNSMHFR